MTRSRPQIQNCVKRYVSYLLAAIESDWLKNQITVSFSTPTLSGLRGRGGGLAIDRSPGLFHFLILGLIFFQNFQYIPNERMYFSQKTDNTKTYQNFQYILHEPIHCSQRPGNTKTYQDKNNCYHFLPFLKSYSTFCLSNIFYLFLLSVINIHRVVY